MTVVTTDLLDRPDARITFDVRGTGPLLVLVGSPMGAEGFGPLADAMAADHTVVRFDPRGTGRSPTEDPDADSTVALRAARPVSSPGCGRCRRAPDSGGAVRQDGAVISTTAAGDAVRARPDSERRRRARAALHDLLPQLSREAVAALGAVEAAGFLARTERWYADAHLPLEALYGAVADPGGLTARLVRAALAAAAARPQALRELDRRREVDGDWFQDPRTVGYVAYTDRFAGTLRGIRTRLDHLSDLGVRYLHLMPLLRPRDGENDGGYAVADYTAVDPRLGTMDDLESLAGALRERGMSLCVDLVLNHTAAEHPWARGWLAGDPRYAGFYTAYPDREMPDAWEATIPDVFPDRAPGSFSWVPGRTAATAAGCGRRSGTTSGTWTGPVPRCSPRCSAPCSPWPGAGSRSCGWTRHRSSASGSARTARTSPRPTTCCRRCTRSPGSRPRPWSSRRRRSSRPTTSSATSAHTTATAPSANWPTTTSSW